MPAESENQQKLFGMALAYKRGEKPDASKEVKELANSMSASQIEEYASTSHKGLPKTKSSAYDMGFRLKMAELLKH